MALLAAAIAFVPAPSGGAPATPRVAIGNARVMEGHASYRTFVFAVTLSEATDRTVTVGYRTSDGSARSGRDYMARTGRASIRAGTRSTSIGVAVLGDTSDEDHETFTVTLFSAVNATISRSRATGTILDDDSSATTASGRPRVSAGDASVVEGNSGGRYVRLPVTLSAKTTRTVAVRWRAVPVTASIRWGDFLAASGVLRIPAGATSATAPVIVRGDRADEPDQTFRLELTYAVGASLYRSEGRGTIVDDDAAGGAATTTTTTAPPAAAHTLRSWGRSDQGQVGDGTTGNHLNPTAIGDATDWAAVAAGDSHSCGIRSPGTLWCWGDNDNGQLGDGTTADRHVPVRVGSATTWATIAAGGDHSCGTRTNGRLYCWGDNASGQVGSGGTTDRSTPTAVGAAGDWKTVSAGGSHTCGTRTNGTLYCWGDNGSGQIGDDTTIDRDAPAQIGSATSWRGVAAGGSHTCGTRAPGTLWCWGLNDTGQLGDGTTTERHAPVQIGTANRWDSLAAGGAHTCGARTAGTLYCWGDNAYGQVGDGSATDRTKPTRVGSTSDWIAITAGGTHTSGIRD